MLGSVAYGSGVVSHAVADGLLPGPFAMALLWVTCVLGAALTLTSRATAARLVVVVLAGQAWVHSVLSISGHRGDTPLVPVAFPEPAAMGAPSGGATLLERFRTASESVPHTAQDDWLAHQIAHFTSLTPAMLAAHLAGAAVMGLFLAVGEDALWRLLALAAVRADARARSVLRSACLLALACSARAIRLLLSEGPQVLGSQVLEAGTERGRAPPFVLAA